MAKKKKRTASKRASDKRRGAPATIPEPANRRLNVFSLDPAVDVRLDTAPISRSILSIPWESLTPGPVGEYVEVVDVDPSSRCAYEPVDLNDAHLLAQDGLQPSTGNPQFHQQMVYAVVMKTIVNFEKVLGRKVLWAERMRDENGKFLYRPRRRFVQRLRVYPHALREQNAYYSPSKKALLFGYFNAPTVDPRDELPGGMVFTCLSHDIVAHETTHAILDGSHSRLLDASNHDMRAFHEAFADIVAIFQHFTLPGLLLDQIQRTRGDLRMDGLLVRLASQFARATRQGNALRNALGTIGPDGRAERPDPSRFSTTFEPHERGAILVAAIFDAFVSIYERRVADLKRIATGGTGRLPAGNIHPDLARRFADEAVWSAQRVLNICIRAIDYLPPVDITFGDYLRALITADADFFPDDPKRYRLAFIQAFRDRGIYPLDVRAFAEDALRWNPPPEGGRQLVAFLPPTAVLRTMAYAYDMPDSVVKTVSGGEQGKWRRAQSAVFKAFRDGNLGKANSTLLSQLWQVSTDSRPTPQSRERKEERWYRHLLERHFARFLHAWITIKAGSIAPGVVGEVGRQLGLDLEGLAKEPNRVRLQVHAVRPTIRLRPDGRSKVELLVMVTQRRYYGLRDEQGEPIVVKGSEDSKGSKSRPLRMKYRGGCTLIIDPEAGRVRYAISKSLLSNARRARHMAFLREQWYRHGTDAVEQYGLTAEAEAAWLKLEPLAIAHRHAGDSEGY